MDAPRATPAGPGYRWLSEQLGIPYKKTHIGYFSLEECLKVVEVCQSRRKHE
jgi:hypothetical protein